MAEQDNQTTLNNVQESVPESERYTGRVKWFNNPRGYGFLSYKGTDGSDKDVFVHYSAISSDTENGFRTLTQGEYVSFSLIESDKPDKLQASNITGVGGGPLLAEQRQQNQRQRGSVSRGGGGRGRGGFGRGGYRGDREDRRDGGGYREDRREDRRDGGGYREDRRNGGDDRRGPPQETQQETQQEKPSEPQVDQPQE